eukprot:120511-Chlamydomonas_euryale.AAC.1
MHTHVNKYPGHAITHQAHNHTCMRGVVSKAFLTFPHNLPTQSSPCTAIPAAHSDNSKLPADGNLKRALTEFEARAHRGRYQPLGICNAGDQNHSRPLRTCTWQDVPSSLGAPQARSGSPRRTTLKGSEPRG